MHVHHLKISTPDWSGNNCQPLYREYMKGEEGYQPGGANSPEAKQNRMETSPFR